MIHESAAGLRLSYYPAEAAAARLVAEACRRTVNLLGERWGLPMPPGCRVYVMTSWPSFLIQSAPGAWKAYVFAFYPLLAARARAIWPHAGGWALSYGRIRVVGVKPPRLMQPAEPGLGAQIFLPDRSPEEKTATVTCHELTHAFTAHLKLPPWLNEGLATLAMEHYLGRPVVRPATLKHLAGPPGPGALRVEKPQALLYVYERGYWLARYIEETNPELLRSLLARRMTRTELEQTVAAACGTDLDAAMKAYFAETASRSSQADSTDR